MTDSTAGKFERFVEEHQAKGAQFLAGHQQASEERLERLVEVTKKPVRKLRDAVTGKG